MSTIVFDKRFFLDEYLVYHLERSKAQWLIAHERLVSYMQAQAPLFSGSQESVLIENIVTASDKTKVLFLQLRSLHENAGIGGEDAIKKDQETRLGSQLLVLSQSSIASAAQLALLSQEEAAAAQRQIVVILCSFIAALFSVVGAIVFFLWKNIVDPIARLQKGVEIIGNGNLQYMVGTRQKDEIGQLSRAFDAMTEKVRERTLKLDASNQQLKASNQQLRASNQQLDANTQQLRAANQQLVASEQTLKEKIDELEVFNRATVGRELKMMELKKEIELLRKKTERL